MTEFFRTLLLLSAAGSILGLLLMLGRRVTGKKLPSTLWYYAWLPVLLRLALPLPGLIPGVQTAEKSDAKPLAVQAERAEEREEAIIPWTDAAYVPSAAAIEAVSRPAPEAAAPETPAEPHMQWGELLKSPGFWLVVWLIGAALCFARYAVGYARFRRILLRTLETTDGQTARIYKELDAKRKPRLLCSRYVATPMLLGLFRPLIVLPQCGYSAESAANILRHELTHYRRGDLYVKWFFVLTASLHWFNPLMLLFRRELDRVCELSCDETVLARMEPSQRRSYGETLLDLAANRTLPAGVVATTFATEKRVLRERLEQIMKFKHKPRAIIALSLAAVLLIGAAALAAGPARADQAEPTREVSPAYTTPAPEPLTEVSPAFPAEKEPDASGTCGDNLTWTISDGVLTISGTGDMEDYPLNGAPWHDLGFGVTEIVIGPGVTSIGSGAFYFCAMLKSASIGEDVTSIGSFAFFGCGELTEITIPDSVTTIGENAFYDCIGLTEVRLGCGVTTLGYGAFIGCVNLTSITIPDCVEAIGEHTFYYCDRLAAVTIPVSVKSIGAAAFSGCEALTDIYYGGSVAAWEEIAVADHNDMLLSAKIHYLSAGPEREEEIIMTVDTSYWEEVDRELASFAHSGLVEVYVTEGFDETLPEDDVFGPLTLEDYIYGTDGWKFTYNSETIANDPAATIIVRDADGRSLWIMDDADALMIEEADGSITWVEYTGEHVDCADMIRHLLPWARGEYKSEEELLAERLKEQEAAAEAALAELGYYGLPDLEPVNMSGGEATPFWAGLSELPTGPYVTLFYGTDEISVDLHYERVYEDEAHTRPLGAEAYEQCRSFFAGSEGETVTDVPRDSIRAFVTDGIIYYGPRIVWYDEANDLLFSMIAHHCDGGQPLGSFTTEELIALAQSVSRQYGPAFALLTEKVVAARISGFGKTVEVTDPETLEALLADMSSLSWSPTDEDITTPGGIVITVVLTAEDGTEAELTYPLFEYGGAVYTCDPQVVTVLGAYME